MNREINHGVFRIRLDNDPILGEVIKIQDTLTGSANLISRDIGNGIMIDPLSDDAFANMFEDVVETIKN